MQGWSLPPNPKDSLHPCYCLGISHHTHAQVPATALLVEVADCWESPGGKAPQVSVKKSQEPPVIPPTPTPTPAPAPTASSPALTSSQQQWQHTQCLGPARANA